MPTKQQLNSLIRKKAAETLFSALSALNIRAILMGSPAIALYDASQRAAKELVALIDHPSLTFLELTHVLVSHDHHHFKRNPNRTHEWVVFQAPEIPEIARNQCSIRFRFSRDLFEGHATIESLDVPLLDGIPVLPLAHIFCFQLDLWAGKFERQERGLSGAAEIVTSCIEVILKEPPLLDYKDALVFFPLTQQRLGLFGVQYPKISARLSQLQKKLIHTPLQTTSVAEPGEVEMVLNHYQVFPTSTRPNETSSPSGSLLPHSNRMASIQNMNALLRAKAAETLFSAFSVLNIRAALMGRSALTLYDGTQRGAKELIIAVDHPDMTFAGLCKHLVTVDQHHFHPKTGPQRLDFQAAEIPEISKRHCRIYICFFRDLIQLDTGKEIEFPMVSLIQGVPLLPLAWIFCFALKNWEDMLNVQAKKGFRKAAMLLDSCIRAVTKRDPSTMATDFTNALTFFPRFEQQLAEFEERNHDLTASSGLPGLRRVLGFLETASPQCIPTGGHQPPSPLLALGPIIVPVPPTGTLEMPSKNTATMRSIAMESVVLIKNLGFNCALFGSMACELYGNRRPPKDLDILVLPSPSPNLSQIEQEWIKKQLVKWNKRFFLKRAKDPNATYRVLYYRFDQHTTLPPNFTARRCKIDILLPGIMDLPHLSGHQINYIDGLPVVPFIVLLLQKLQGWDDHLNCAEAHKFRKHPIDAQDIKNLLEIAPDLSMRVVRPWSERDVLSSGFQQASVERVKRFCQSFPETMEQWRSLGFEAI